MVNPTRKGTDMADKKLTSGNTPLLAAAKQLYSVRIYSVLVHVINDDGHEACRNWLRARGLPGDPESTLRRVEEV